LPKIREKEGGWMVSPKSLGYTEIAEITHRKRKPKRLSRLYSVRRQSQTLRGYQIKMEIFVPHPSFDSPVPAIFLLIQNPTGKLWERFNSVEALQGFLSLNEQDLAGLQDALDQARDMAERLEKARDEATTALSLAREPENSRELEKD